MEEGIILIHRIKRQEDKSLREYYVVPGGKMEKGETEEETLIREVKEEIGIKVKVKEKILEYDSKYNDSIQIFYECEYVDGIIGTGNGPEMQEEREEEELFRVEIIEKEKISKINFVPQKIEEMLK